MHAVESWPTFWIKEFRSVARSSESLTLCDAHVHVVVVMYEWLNDAGRPRQSGSRPDENELGASSNEAVDEVLGTRSIGLTGPEWSELPPITARIIDVDIQSVLVRRVPQTTKSPAEVTASGTTDIADGDSRRVGMLRHVRP
jgi:hypothetical protein